MFFVSFLPSQNIVSARCLNTIYIFELMEMIMAVWFNGYSPQNLFNVVYNLEQHRITKLNNALKYESFFTQTKMPSHSFKSIT